MINIYYNEFVTQNPRIKSLQVVCGKTFQSYIELETIDITNVPHSDQVQIENYIRIRNFEEGRPFSRQKEEKINKKAQYLLKKLDKTGATDYINSEFRDQVWNKDGGFDDKVKKLRGKTTSSSQRSAAPTASPTQPSAGGYSGGGGSSSGY